MTKALYKKHTVRGIIGKVLLYAFFVLVAVIMLLPFYWSLVASFRPETENQMGFSLIPKTFTLSQYATFFERVADVGAGISVFEIFGNTLFIVACVILLSLLTCSLGAYALTHLHLPGEKIILKIMTASMMLPGIVTLIPSFLVVDFLGLTNNFGGVIIPAAFSIYGVLFLRSFFKQTPSEMAEAARIDGAGELYIFFRIYCPLILPGFLTLGLFTFNSNYNSFLWPSIVLAPEQMTLGIVLREFQMVVSDTGALMAGALITCIPTFIIFLVGQKYFMENLAFSGIK
ncbi:carbohydrate ABC transporter permease [Pumilibacter intestinalis]|uniref:carbohydrate ABC transporter permease n=1 Tax=Pumilibacter intestinalis TaxID=2941511 RepID=UPI0020412126|nr:carbohydrate ABC transporter permease [Pumilibacter intestinalis]